MRKKRAAIFVAVTLCAFPMRAPAADTDEFPAAVVEMLKGLDGPFILPVAEDCLEYIEYQRTRDGNLDCTSVQKITVQFGNRAWLRLEAGHQFFGCAKLGFEFTDEDSEVRPGSDDSDRFFKAIHDRLLYEPHIAEFRTRPTHVGDGFRLLIFQGNAYYLPDTPEGVAVKKIVTDFAREMTGKANGRSAVSTRSMEGDFQSPADVRIEELIASPAKYDGKRVRVSGYCPLTGAAYGLVASQYGKGVKKGLWLGPFSKFAPRHTGETGDFKDNYVTVEGTFDSALGEMDMPPGVNQGLAENKIAPVGGIRLITKMQKIPPPWAKKAAWSALGVVCVGIVSVWWWARSRPKIPSHSA